MAETLLALKNVGVTLDDKRILTDITLRIEQGERIIVLGANGAGKSTLLRVAHGLIACSAGARDALPASEQAMLFQRPALLRRSAIANVSFALAARGLSAARVAARAEEALAACNLLHAQHQFARSLSGGEQQRLALACAWGVRPRLLFADEPTASLDPNAVQEVESRLLALHSQGTAIMMTTHNLAQAKRIAQRIIFLHRGAVTDDIAAAQFFAGEQSPHAKVFFEGERL
jgi:tungstate transport system ATP-binding protein